jgi:PIN domain nuclease of toxin-antitoxin system
LSHALRSAIADPDVSVAISLASFWEMTVKHRKGKLPLPVPFDEDPSAAFQEWCARALIDIVPIEAAFIAQAAKLENAPEDPFDRLIAATAIVRGEALVSADGKLAAIVGLTVIQV